jgi:hypothetical protein
MTTYSTAEAALLTLTRAYSAGTVFTTANAVADDWTVLDAQGTTVAAVLEMASDTIEAITVDAQSYGDYGAYQEVHQIGVWLCVKREQGLGGDGAAKAALKTLTDAYRDYMRPYRRLNAATGVRQAKMTKTTAPAYISPTRNAADATHVAQMITFEVACESDAPVGEIDG